MANGSGSYIKVGAWALVLFLAGLGAWWVDLQGKVDASQDTRIEAKVDKDQYWRDQDRMFKQLTRIEDAVK